jgi:hypothetical protein
MPVVFKQRNGKALLRVSNATETFVVAGNSAVSNIAVANVESVISADISAVYFSGTVTVARGANNVLTLSGTGFFDFAGQGNSLTEWNAANVVITATGATCVLELSKNTTGETEY